MSELNLLDIIKKDSDSLNTLLEEFKTRKAELDSMIGSLPSGPVDEYSGNTEDFRNRNKKMKFSEIKILVELKRLELDIRKEINNIIDKEVNIRFKMKDSDENFAIKLDNAIDNFIKGGETMADVYNDDEDIDEDIYPKNEEDIDAEEIDIEKMKPEDFYIHGLDNKVVDKKNIKIGSF